MPYTQNFPVDLEEDLVWLIFGIILCFWETAHLRPPPLPLPNDGLEARGGLPYETDGDARRKFLI